MNNDIKSRKRQVCVNCGKIINPNTLICDACGTDYNDKPKCDHFYTKFMYETLPINRSVVVMLKCGRCGEITSLNCSEELFADLYKRLF